MGDEIKRYANYGGSMVDRNHGEYVGYDDHLEALASLRAGNERLRDRIEKLEAVAQGVEEIVGSFGYHLELLDYSGQEGDIEDLDVTVDMAEKLADRARSLLSGPAPDFEGDTQ